ncbi:MAG: transglycosylase SLT domain-containing protein [Pseudomonadota bacterium]
MRVRLLITGLALALALVPIGYLSASLGAEPAAREAMTRIVIEEALKTSFPPSLALAVTEAASNFDPRHQGPGGRRGLMQLTPAIAVELGEADPAALWEPRTNARLGIAYLEQLMRANGGRLAPALQAFARTDGQPSAFVHRVERLSRRYRQESALWLDVLKDEPVPWTELRPDDAGLLRLADLARRMEDAEPDIERRRRAILPYLDDFAGPGVR